METEIVHCFRVGLLEDRMSQVRVRLYTQSKVTYVRVYTTRVVLSQIGD